MTFSRRNLRIKVMQALYAHLQNPDADLQVLKKNLQANIEITDKILFFNLYFLSRVANYSIDDKQNQASKHLADNKQSNVSITIYENQWMRLLLDNEHFKKYVEKQKPYLNVDDDLVRRVYGLLKADETYQTFTAIEQPDDVAVSRILIHLYQFIIYEDENFHSLVEEIYPSWMDEHTFILKQMDVMLNTGKFEIVIAEQKEATDFGRLLFETVVDNEADFNELITPKLVGWDADRIAQIDMILMKMCLAELLFFPNIPIKVSINEYIDITKSYSTPKSKDFVNGVVDKIKNELLTEGKIKKQGRGLVNE